MDYSNFISVGDSVIEYYDNNLDSIITPGSEGENKTWDFRLLHQNSLDTINIADVRNTLFYNDFKSVSNIAITLTSTDSVASFFHYTENELILKGSGYFLSSEKKIHLEERTVLKYPLDYLDQHKETFKKEDVLYKNKLNNDSIKRITTYEHSYIADAWGDVKLPGGQFFSLRIKRALIITESYYKYSNYIWHKYKEEKFPSVTYEWWTDDPKTKHHVAYMVMDAENAKPVHVSFLSVLSFDKEIEKIKPIPLVLYPNPVLDVVHVNLPKKNVYANIYSISGQLVYSELITLNKIQINVSNFMAGTYVFIVKDRNGNILGSTKFVKK
ncbi:MAG: T9SS type A sorting domain-containing protein [Flavobacteriaceae bacterium]